MLTSETRARKPGAFTAMTGLTSVECEILLAEVREPEEAARREQAAPPPLCWLVPSSARTSCGRSLGHNLGTQGVCAL